MEQINISSYSIYYKIQTVDCNEFADTFEFQAEPCCTKSENDLHLKCKFSVNIWRKNKAKWYFGKKVRSQKPPLWSWCINMVHRTVWLY